MAINNDVKINISIANSRQSVKWINKDINWSDLVTKLSQEHKTNETMDEFLKMSKTKQDAIKDIGGFVGGSLKDGRRLKDHVISRSLITLDMDYAKLGDWEELESGVIYYSCCAYGTHKYRPNNPRIRIVIPLDRAVTPDEYEAISRKIADSLGIDAFDDTTYEANRLMYWPSTPKDIDYFFRFIDLPILKADDVLDSYKGNWSDCSFWPRSSREGELVKTSAKKQGDPLEKDGLIGAFCRTYTIQEVIELFLSDKYVKCSNGHYTYLGGSSSGGLVIYDDKFAYSHHATDPISGKTVNAFDIVRLHKYADLDVDVNSNTPINKYPSWSKMCEFVSNDANVKKTLVEERLNAAVGDFAEDFKDNSYDENDDILNELLGGSVDVTPKKVATKAKENDWMSNLTITNKGVIEKTINNILIILDNDPRLKGLLRTNTLSGRREISRKAPWPRFTENLTWTDSDESGLMWIMEYGYQIDVKQKVLNAIDIEFSKNHYHPIRSYLKDLKWDGVKRVESLIIDYLGGEDNTFTREATTKFMIAAVKRVFEPGCKFDNMLTLVGPQGIGKSLIFQKLAKGLDWYSDSLGDINRDKDSYEALDGKWIVEMSELESLKKSDAETIKKFISKQNDAYRKAYARNISDNYRQCVFIGTTNKEEFLVDETGNRRFWIVDCEPERRTKLVWEDLTEDVVDLIWAEAVMLYKENKLNINEISIEAKNILTKSHEEHTAYSELSGLIDDFVMKKIPSNWKEFSVEERRQYFRATEDYALETYGDNLVRRDYISIIEICVEMLDMSINKIDANRRYDVRKALAQCKLVKRGRMTRHTGPYGKQKAFEIKY